jgi:hypothetical protein
MDRSAGDLYAHSILTLLRLSRRMASDGMEYGLQLVFDVLRLALLYFSGGPTNPFVFYLFR